MKKLFTLFPRKSTLMLLGVLFVLVQSLFFNVAFGQTINQPFTAGNLVVYRVGTGSAALSSKSTAGFLDEYQTTGGTPVNSIVLPTAALSGGVYPFTTSGTATTEGALTLSDNGLYLVASGYGTVPGTSSVSSSRGSAIPRVAARIDHTGAVNTTSAFSSWADGSNPRGVYTADGTNLWMAGGDSGIVYAAFGGGLTSAIKISSNTSATPGPVVTPAISNFRRVFAATPPGTANGALQLYATSTGSATNPMCLGTVGTGLPTTAPTDPNNVVTLPGILTQGLEFYNVFFADLTTTVPGYDVIYVSDLGGGTVNGVEGSANQPPTSGSLVKYSLVNGSWAFNGAIVIDSATGLAGNKATDGTVSLYVTNYKKVFSITDASGYSGALTSTATVIATAAANTQFRDIAFAPVAGVTPTTTQVTLIDGGNTPTAGVPFNITVEAQDNNGRTGQVTANTTITISVASGSGTATGTGIITTGNSSVSFPVTYTNSGNNAETNIQLQVTATGLAANQSGFFNVLGQANALSFGTFPTTGSASSALTSFTVNAVNSGVTDATFTGTVTLTEASGTAGELSGTLTATAAAGVATFSNVLLNAGGAYTLSASSTGLTGAISPTVTITPGSLSFMGFPSSGAQNSALTSFTVKALEGDGVTLDNTFAGTVTLTLASGPGTLGGTLTATAVGGIATFNNVTLSALGVYTLTAASSGFTSATSSSVTITGAATYTWNVASGNWSSPASWSPARTSPQSSDVLVLDGSVIASPSVTADFTTTQIIGSLSFTNNVNATITTASTASIAIDINGGTGQVFTVASGCSLTVTTGATAAGLGIKIGSGFTGLINGVVTFKGSASTALGTHTLTSTGANSIVFGNGALFIQGANMTTAAFATSGTANQVLFQSGSGYTYASNAKSTTINTAAVQFQAGSTWYMDISRPTVTTLVGDYITMSGLTFPNFVVEADMWQENGFSSNVIFNNFTVNPNMAFNFWQNTKTGGSTAAWVVNGNLVVGAGATFKYGTGPYKLLNTGALTLNGPANIINTTSVVDSISYLTLNSGAALTIASGVNLVITGSLVNAGSIIVESGAIVTVNGALTNTGTFTIQDGASLVQPTDGTASGAGYTVVRDGSTSPLIYNLWSSPISSGSLGVLGGSIYEYVETAPTRTPTSYTTGWVSATGTMAVGQGYIATNSPAVSFTGTINSGTLPIGVTYSPIQNNPLFDGWNLLGNPYPSDISVSQFLTANSVTTAAISGAGVYFWSGSQNQYITANSGNIPSCQAFFVHAQNPTSGTITFTNALRQQSSTAFYRETALQDAVAVLTIANPNGKTDQTQIEFRTGATNSFNINEDAYKLKGNDTLNFYSEVAGNSYEYAIQVLAPLTISSTVKLGYDAAVAGQYTISIADTTGFGGVDVLLLDNLLSSTYDLRQGGYQFTSGSVTNDTSRFSVVFVPQALTVTNVTGVASANIQSGNRTNIYAFNKIVYVQNSVPSNVVISDITGRNVYQGNSTEINMTGATTGVYIVSVVDGNGVTTQKVVIQ